MSFAKSIPATQLHLDTKTRDSHLGSATPQTRFSLQKKPVRRDQGNLNERDCLLAIKRWRVGWLCRSSSPPTVLRVTTPLASTANFHLLTSFQIGSANANPVANQNGEAFTQKQSVAMRHHDTTPVLSPIPTQPTREIPVVDTDLT